MMKTETNEVITSIRNYIFKIPNNNAYTFLGTVEEVLTTNVKF